MRKIFLMTGIGLTMAHKTFAFDCTDSISGKLIKTCVQIDFDQSFGKMLNIGINRNKNFALQACYSRGFIAWENSVEKIEVVGRAPENIENPDQRTLVVAQTFSCEPW